jgi:hypothetical protein
MTERKQGTSAGAFWAGFSSGPRAPRAHSILDASLGVRALAAMERDAVYSWSPAGADNSGVRLHFADGTYADYTAEDIARAAEGRHRTGMNPRRAS